MSASFHWIAWSSAIGWPKVCRSLARSATASSNAACAIPSACAAIPIRPLSSERHRDLEPLALCAEPREVKLGGRSRSRVEILSGLQPGERIVISGNFLIDSESQLKTSPGGASK